MRYIISFGLASTLAVAAAAGPAPAEAPQVVTDIPPVHSLAAMVMGDRGTPALILPPGADAHDLQLSPSQARAIAGADLAVWSGPSMAPWFAEALTSLGSDSALALLDAPGTELRSLAGSGETRHAEGHGHAEGLGHAGGAEHDHDHASDHGHAHDHGGIDPHAWLDPGNARLWVGAIAEALAAADPEGAEVYRANAVAAAARIDAAEAAAAARLAPVRARPLVVQHDAYGYFAARFGLTVIGAVADGEAAAPGAGRLAALRDRLAGAPGACVYPEANHDPALAADLAAAAGLPLGPALDPEGSALPPGPELYPQLLESLAERIAACAPGG